jgi:hypothetical protein
VVSSLLTHCDYEIHKKLKNVEYYLIDLDNIENNEFVSSAVKNLDESKVIYTLANALKNKYGVKYIQIEDINDFYVDHQSYKLLYEILKDENSFIDFLDYGTLTTDNDNH